MKIINAYLLENEGLLPAWLIHNRKIVQSKCKTYYEYSTRLYDELIPSSVYMNSDKPLSGIANKIISTTKNSIKVNFRYEYKSMANKVKGNVQLVQLNILIDVIEKGTYGISHYYFGDCVLDQDPCLAFKTVNKYLTELSNYNVILSRLRKTQLGDPKSKQIFSKIKQKLLY